MDFSDAIKRILGGESLDDVVDNLIEAEVTPDHQALGTLKKALRELVTFSKKGGFSAVITGAPTSKQQGYARLADRHLVSLTTYWLKMRVPQIGELQATGGTKARNFDMMCDEVKKLSTLLNYANVNDTVMSASIRATEAAAVFKGLA